MGRFPKVNRIKGIKKLIGYYFYGKCVRTFFRQGMTSGVWSVFLLFSSLDKDRSESYVSEMNSMWIAYAVLGLVAGFASGCFGIGGGAIMVPALILFFKVPYHTAIGTSLALILPIAIAGSTKNFQLGKIDWNIFYAAAIAGIIGTLAGVSLIQKIPPEYARKGFALFLIFAAVRLWMK